MAVTRSTVQTTTGKVNTIFRTAAATQAAGVTQQASGTVNNSVNKVKENSNISTGASVAASQNNAN